MLVTSGCWWLYPGDNLDVSDRISILVTSFGYWCPTLMLKDRVCWWQKRPKPSPTSQSCHQHISSPTSVTKIDVTILKTYIECIIIWKFYLSLETKYVVMRVSNLQSCFQMYVSNCTEQFAGYITSHGRFRVWVFRIYNAGNFILIYHRRNYFIIWVLQRLQGYLCYYKIYTFHLKLRKNSLL